MSIKNSAIHHVTLFFAMAVLMSFQTSCTRNAKKQNVKKVVQESLEEGWSMLFDGMTLDGWEVTNFGTEGPVDISGNSIILGMGDGCTGITWKGNFPKMDYEVSLEAKKVSGNDFFCGMTFPFDDTYCSLIIGGWGGPVVGLSIIDGLDASENETRILKKFDHDKWYQIRLKVSGNKIEAWIDNEEVVNFNTEGRELDIRPEVSLSRPFGICSWVTTAAIRKIKLFKDQS